MRPTIDIWLEIIHKRLDAGESAVVAISKANLVTNAYIARFDKFLETHPPVCVRVEATAAEDRVPPEYFTPFAQTEKQDVELGITPEREAQIKTWANQTADEIVSKHEDTLPIPPPGYIAGDPNAR